MGAVRGSIVVQQAGGLRRCSTRQLAKRSLTSVLYRKDGMRCGARTETGRRVVSFSLNVRQGTGKVGVASYDHANECTYLLADVSQARLSVV